MNFFTHFGSFCQQLCALNVYGDNTVIVKEECINHVAKRLRTALRKLSTKSKKKGVTLGGRGRGKLTHPAVVKRTHYYGVAIRAHPNNLAAMTDAVFARYYHAISTDDSLQHERCPFGEDSWCVFKRAEATGETPGPHRDNVLEKFNYDWITDIHTTAEMNTPRHEYDLYHE